MSTSRVVTERGLFCEDWTAGEEVQLLETVEEFGYGNWASVADKLGRRLEVSWRHLHSSLYSMSYTSRPSDTVLSRPLTAAESSQSLVINDRGSGPVPPYYSGQEIGCYLPHRGDFAVEPLNGAEKLISDLELEPDEDEDELTIALKLAAIKMYSEKVKERTFRKWLIKEYGLIDIRKQIATDKIKLSKTQLAIKKQLRPFMRFMSPQSAYKLLQSLFLADELKEEIRRLKSYRANGITTKRGAELCEQLRRRRRQQRQLHSDALRNACTVEESLFSQLVLRKPDDKATPAVKEKQAVYDITHLSGVERLTSEERELCQACRLHPEALLGYLALLEGEWQRCSKLRLVDARRLLKIDVNKTRKIYNFLASRGFGHQS